VDRDLDGAPFVLNAKVLVLKVRIALYQKGVRTSVQPRARQ